MGKCLSLLSSSPSKYPKIYNKSADYYQLGTTIYQNFNRVIVVIGLILISAIGYWDYQSNEKIEGVFSLFYFILQMTPIMLMELSSFSYFKQMRKLNVKATRKAELFPRGLFNYVSKLLVILAVITNISSVLFIFYLDGFSLSWTSDTSIIFFTLLLSNLLYVVIIRFNISGKKLDPYQATSDRIKQTKSVVQSLISISIVASLFIMLNQMLNYYSLEPYRIIFIILYLQLIAWISLGNMLRTIHIESIDFEVYKAENTVSDK